TETVRGLFCLFAADAAQKTYQMAVCVYNADRSYPVPDHHFPGLMHHNARVDKMFMGHGAHHRFDPCLSPPLPRHVLHIVQQEHSIKLLVFRDGKDRTAMSRQYMIDE